MNTYRDIPYIVHVGPVGSYCAYVRIPDDHPWNKLVDKVTKYRLGEGSREFEVNNGYNDIDIDVHGGLTFCCRMNKGDKEWPQGFTPGAWIGWDYAHYGDFVPNLGIGDTYHSKRSVGEECKYAIDQMLEYKED